MPEAKPMPMTKPMPKTNPAATAQRVRIRVNSAVGDRKGDGGDRSLPPRVPKFRGRRPYGDGDDRRGVTSVVR